MANVALTVSSGRQWPLLAYVDFTFSNVLDDGVAVLAVKLPPNSVVIGGSLNVTTEWNTSTSSTVDIGDTSLATRYGTAIDLQQGTRTPLVLTDYNDTGGLDIKLTPHMTGTAATAGAARLEVLYYITGRVNEVQPT